MNIFYNKSNGHDIMDMIISWILILVKAHSILKRKKGSFFKPCENNNSIYGMPNVNNFLQSRVNPSMKQSNTKPFESIRDTPGIGMDYNEKSQMGFNTTMHRNVATKIS